MPAKILAFDTTRRIPPRRYTPIAMRGRLLQMPSRNSGSGAEATATDDLRLKAAGAEAQGPQAALLRW